MALVFVYGTLKRGGSNHRYLAGQRFVGEARTRPIYRLHLLDGYPGLVEAPSEGRSVEGELWEVDAAALAALDGLEGTAEGLYRRAGVALRPPHDSLRAETYLYLKPVEGRPDLGEKFGG